MTILGICQDCLRIRTFIDWEARDAAHCACGAQELNFCNCTGCMITINALIAGARLRGVPLLQGGVTVTAYSLVAGVVSYRAAR